MIEQVVIFHIPFKQGYRQSGGGIRPSKLIEAYAALGIPHIVIHGSHKERAAQFRDVISKLEKGLISVRYVYSESFAGPAVLSDKKNWWLFQDYLYLVKLHFRKIPIGLFYRDIHWKFGIDTRGLSFLALYIVRALHYFDLLWYLIFVDHLFLPSIEMAKHVPFASRFKISALPPGHDVIKELAIRPENKRLDGVYVGGVSQGVYDVSVLVKGEFKFSVTICCRAEEWNNNKAYYEKLGINAKIVHLSGFELSNLLRLSHLALLMRASHAYLDFSQPLKFYEAIGYELPIVVSPGSLVASQVANWDIGWVTNDPNIEISWSDYLLKLERIKRIKPQHTWTARVSEIEKVMLNED